MFVDIKTVMYKDKGDCLLSIAELYIDDFVDVLKFLCAVIRTFPRWACCFVIKSFLLA